MFTLLENSNKQLPSAPTPSPELYTRSQSLDGDSENFFLKIFLDQTWWEMTSVDGFFSSAYSSIVQNIILAKVLVPGDTLKMSKK